MYHFKRTTPAGTTRARVSVASMLDEFVDEALLDAVMRRNQAEQAWADYHDLDVAPVPAGFCPDEPEQRRNAYWRADGGLTQAARDHVGGDSLDVAHQLIDLVVDQVRMVQRIDQMRETLASDHESRERLDELVSKVADCRARAIHWLAEAEFDIRRAELAAA